MTVEVDDIRTPPRSYINARYPIRKQLRLKGRAEITPLRHANQEGANI